MRANAAAASAGRFRQTEGISVAGGCHDPLPGEPRRVFRVRTEAIKGRRRSVQGRLAGPPREGRDDWGDRTGLGRRHGFASASSTCAACPSGLTALNTLVTRPLPSITNVLRTMPSDFFPYSVFSRHAP